MPILPPGQLEAVFTDTFTVNAYTVREQNTFSTNLVTNLIGSDDDEVYGKSTAGLHFQVLLPSNNVNFAPDTSIFGYGPVDSVVLNLRLLDFFGDIRRRQSLEVFKLTEQLQTGVVYTSDKQLLRESTPLGSKLDFFVDTDDSVKNLGLTEPPQIQIRLDQAFGQQLFDLSGDPELENDSSFLQFLPGLYVGAADTAVHGFGKGFMLIDPNSLFSNVTIYYQQISRLVGDSVTADGDTIDLPDRYKNETVGFSFPIAGATTSAHYTHNYKGSGVEQYIGKPADGEEPDSILFFQGMGGLKAKIEIPHLAELGTVAINRAVVRFKLNNESAEDGIFPAPGLAYFIGAKSEGQGVFRDTLNNRAQLGRNNRPRSACLDCENDFFFISRADEIYWSVRDQLEGDAHYGGFRSTFTRADGSTYEGYELNLTREFQGILNGDVENDGFLLIPFPYFRIANRGIVGSFNHPDERNRMELEIVYTVLE